MTASNLFNQLKAGKITKEQFLYQVRKDSNLPWISNLTTFNESIKILQNRGIITEVFEMGSLEEDNCSCGGSYESHEDAGEKVCASCGDRKPIKEESDDYDYDADFPDSDEFDPDLDAERNYGVEDIDHDRDEDSNNDIDEEDEDEEIEDMLAKYDFEKKGKEELDAQWDLEEEEEPSLKEQVVKFIENAVKGGSSMEEAKNQAKEYFSKKQESLNEAKVHLNPDQVNPYELEKGIEIEMGYEYKPAPTWAQAKLMDIANLYAKAQSKALKNLAKDPAYYTNHIAKKGPEKKSPKVKADGYVKVPKAKMEKSNVSVKKEGPVKTKGVKVMPDKGVTGSEKIINESDKYSKIKEYVVSQLKKETQLVKSKKTGETIDVVPDQQAAQMQAALAKKGVQTTKTSV